MREKVNGQAGSLPPIKVLKTVDSRESSLTIGLIDCFQFTKECMAKVLETIRPRATIVAFSSVQACIAENRTDLNVILYASHSSIVSEVQTMQRVVALRRALPGVRVIILSDMDDGRQPRMIRSALKSGAAGFLPIRTTNVHMAVAAIRFVMAGGIFAPLDLLLTSPPGAHAPPKAAQLQRELTSRQMAVLAHLKQGKANKLIAHELSVSESAVKVHVRNIMRKIGATNRTQAAFKAQNFCNGTKPAKGSDA